MQARYTDRKKAPPAPSGRVFAPDLGVPIKECLLTPEAPCCIVILGASGDLTARKLVPALYNLFLSRTLPRAFSVVGCARTPFTTDAFREKMRRAVVAAGLPLTRWGSFASRLIYHPVDYGSASSLRTFGETTLREQDRRFKTGGNTLFYLALPMLLYENLAGTLAESGLAAPKEGGSWPRVVVEKPYGSDLAGAQALDRALHRTFSEEQIFRIDHYLAKETVQDILIFRFANSIFEPVWNRDYVQRVEILAWETLGVEHRAGYYDRAGVMRDMFQSHMMQILALTAMDPPSHFEAVSVQDEKAKVFRSLRPFPLEHLDENLVFGQYTAGKVEGRKVPGYLQEAGVRKESPVPTFALLRLFIDNWRWEGVPFYISSGKRLAEKRTEISIHFKPVPHSLFRGILGGEITANRITIGIQPRESINLQFQTKNPGAKVCLRTVTMDFDYSQNYRGPLLDAYEKALLDVMAGDHMLFWRQDGIELTWSYLDPILEHCETCVPSPPLHPYPAGSAGPPAALDLLRRNDATA